MGKRQCIRLYVGLKMYRMRYDAVASTDHASHACLQAVDYELTVYPGCLVLIRSSCRAGLAGW